MAKVNNPEEYPQVDVGARPRNEGQTLPIPTIPHTNVDSRYAGTIRAAPLYTGKPGSISLEDWITAIESSCTQMGITSDEGKIQEARNRVEYSGLGKLLIHGQEFDDWKDFITHITKWMRPALTTENSVLTAAMNAR